MTQVHCLFTDGCSGMASHYHVSHARYDKDVLMFSLFPNIRRTQVPRGSLLKKCRTLSIFVPGNLDLPPLTPKFEIGRDFYTEHLTAKFRHPMFNRSEVILLTNRQIDRQTDRQADAAENIHLASLCYAGG